jgi:hypothetical protein
LYGKKEYEEVTLWTETNKMFEEAKQLTYAKLKSKGVWNKKQTRWTKRNKG